MLTEKQRSFLKLIVLIATKYNAKGMITGLVEVHTMIASIISNRIKNRDFDRYNEPGSNTAECLQDELGALAKTLIDEEVLDHAADTILSKHLSKTKIEIFSEIVNILNDESIINNLDKEDIQFILDDPNIKVASANDKESKEAILRDIVSKTDASEEEVKAWLENQVDLIKEDNDNDDEMLEAINDAFDTKNGKVDLSNIINMMDFKKKRESKNQ